MDQILPQSYPLYVVSSDGAEPIIVPVVAWRRYDEGLLFPICVWPDSSARELADDEKVLLITADLKLAEARRLLVAIEMKHNAKQEEA